jgi:pyruvate-formate lyase-activating enzyme
MKFEIDYLDIVTIRSCQLKCEGCCTFSDHREINGLEEAEDYEKQLEHWAKFLSPKRTNIFGGEPLMHPRFINWFRLIRKNWPTLPIWVNTNGYYLDKLFEHVDELFIESELSLLFIAITKHTQDEPYGSLVDSNLQKLLDLIKHAREKKHQTEFIWVRATEYESEHKKFYRLIKSNDPDTGFGLISYCEQYNDNFVPHYRGHGATLQPWHNYNDSAGMINNHEVCHIKKYVQFYKGDLYKCPPRAVLNHTLDTYGLSENEEWVDYYKDYTPLKLTDSEETIKKWLYQQNLPEKTCNMCGFMHSHEYLPITQHFPKKMFKIKAG